MEQYSRVNDANIEDSETMIVEGIRIISTVMSENW